MAGIDFTAEELSGEQWRPVSGAAGKYSVSDLGRVRSEPRITHSSDGSVRPFRGQMLRPRQVTGYHQALMWISGKVVGQMVHRLVFVAFVREIPAGMQINHIDGDKSNNRLRNLELVTPRANCAHAVRTGLMPRGERTGSAKLSNEQALAILARHRRGERVTDLAREFGLSKCSVTHLVTGRNWNHVTGLPLLRNRRISG